MTSLPLTTTVPRVLLARIDNPRPTTMKRLAAQTHPAGLLIPGDGTLYAIYADVSPDLADRILCSIVPQGARIDTELIAFKDAHPAVEHLIYQLVGMEEPCSSSPGGVA